MKRDELSLHERIEKLQLPSIDYTFLLRAKVFEDEGMRLLLMYSKAMQNKAFEHTALQIRQSEGFVLIKGFPPTVMSRVTGRSSFLESSGRLVS